MRLIFLLLIGFIFGRPSFGQEVDVSMHRKFTPMMGWSSWNNFRTNINENLIKREANAMVSSGMKAAGYKYIDIDDGWQGGRNENEKLISDPRRFPNGMKALADYIHSKGLKAGIYDVVGTNTCGSMWDQDTIGVGTGLYHHEWQDINRLMKEWDYDFLKVDWCRAGMLGLEAQPSYSLIGNIIRKVKPEAIYNVGHAPFQGTWVINVADSWRISGDIRSNYKTILHIIDINADLWKYAGPGHVNDMDMLQVGRGMTYEEDKTHFSMWCMMASPLLAGNDLTKISKQTLSILTNKEMIAIDQDPLVYQARRLKDYGEREIWARPLKSTMSGEIAVALLNRSDKKQKVSFNIDSVGLNHDKGYVTRDVWKKTTSQTQYKPVQEYEVGPHGIVVLRIKGISRPYNIFQNF